MQPDDAAIMERVQHGEVELFDRLAERYRSALLRLAENKLGDRGWAEDVVQEALMAAFAARGSFKPAYSFRTWLWTILLNLCRKQWKRSSRKPRVLAESVVGGLDKPMSPEPSVVETGLSVAIRNEESARLQTMLGELPEVQADALRLRFFGGLQYNEIAAAMGSSLGAAKVRVRKGLNQLARRLKDEEGDLT